MSIKTKIINLLGGEAKTNNTALGRQFLRYGNRGDNLLADWSDIKMADNEMYRGYSYAVIQKRANKVAGLAKSNLTTWVKPEALEIYNEKDEEPIHPYLKVIQDSTKFSEKQFWKTISIYLDLAGRYYLGVVRKYVKSSNPKLQDITSNVKEFVLLNPYEVRRVINSDGVVAGYIERKKDGRYREWPKEMIIEMREMNPFDNDSQWAITDAAKEAVYTLNKTGDYTRQSLNGNIDAPGIITTDVILDDNDFANFRERVVQHRKGEPIFGNGAGAIKWDSMQVDLDKAALMDINEINRTTLFAVSGTSKTSLGIEQSGTTRETARVQSEQFVADTAQPRLDDIIDFLNLDYKRTYKETYDKIGYTLEVKSAVASDYDTETKAVGLRKEQFALAQELIYAGYSETSAYQYAQGEIELGDLEQNTPPTPDEESGEGGQGTPPQTPPETPQGPSEPEGEEQSVEGKIRVDNLDKDPNANLDVDDPFVNHEHCEGECSCCHNSPSIETYTNDIDNLEAEGITKAYDELLKEIRSVQRKAIKESEENITINAFDENDLISKEERDKLVKRLTKAFNKYWTILVPLFATRLVNKRNKEFNANYTFKFDNALEDLVKNNAKKVADGHITTIMGDILEASNKAYTNIVENAAADLILKAYRQNPEKFAQYFEAEPTIPEVKSAIHSTEILEENRKIYEKANRLAMEGLDRRSVVKAIREEYKHLSETRATTIARNETSRAFGQSQYQADYQFLNSIGKLNKAYKELYSRTGNPCPYCQKLIERGPIPFTENFLNKGDSIEIVENGKLRTFTANYENIASGTVHVNCQCGYRLVFLDDNGKVADVYNSIWDESNNSRPNNTCNWLDSHSNTTETKELIKDKQ